MGEDEEGEAGEGGDDGGYEGGVDVGEVWDREGFVEGVVKDDGDDADEG